MQGGEGGVKGGEGGVKGVEGGRPHQKGSLTRGVKRKQKETVIFGTSSECV